jgi:succinoglycan biosynthesis protein ExoU
VADIEVAVVIAARNAAGTIAEAVRSALAQDHVGEVIAVDDASADATAAAARSADDGSARLTVLVAEHNLGPAAARNLALARAVSPYFCVLDADDYMLPGRMARLLGSTAAAWDLIADDMIILPQADAARLSFSLKRDGGGAHMLDLERFVLGNISRPGRPRGELGFLKPVVSRAFMSGHGLAYDGALRLGEDYAFYVRALIGGARFALVSACGYVAVERPDSLSSRHSADDLRRIAEFDAAMLAATSRLSSREQRALAAHRDAMWRKYIYGAALDLKRAKGMPAALAMLARSPSALPYVLAETLRAKRDALLRRVTPAATRRGRPRFLVGMPEAQFTDIRSVAEETSAARR